MSRSLIRKNQLHPDISDLVGEYGSGYFLSNQNAVFTTGNQTISGAKTFGTGIILKNATVGNPSNLSQAHGLQFLGLGGTNWDTAIYGTYDGYQKLAIAFKITGASTLTDIIEFSPSIINSSRPLIAQNLIYNTGNQTISGQKTFINSNDKTVSRFEGPNGNPLEIIIADEDESIVGYGSSAFAIGVGSAGVAIKYGFSATDWGQPILVEENPAGGNVVYPDGPVTFSNPLIAPNLVYNTGNQFVSGNKNFISRPTVNNTGVVLSGEAVSSNGTITTMIKLTQAQYNALSPKDPTTFYVIVD